jgi:hypothetical protein
VCAGKNTIISAASSHPLPHRPPTAPSPSADALPPSCHQGALLLYLRWINRAGQATILPPGLLASIHFFERMIPLLRLSTDPNVIIATTMCLYDVMVMRAIRTGPSDQSAHLEYLVARPAYLTPLLDTARAGAAGEPREVVTRVQVVAPLLLVGAAALSWRPAEERAAHEQLLGASWLWDLLRRAVEGGADDFSAMLGGLATYLATLARRAGERLPGCAPAPSQLGLSIMYSQGDRAPSCVVLASTY